VTFTSGKSYIVSGSNWTFVGAQPATTTTTSTTSTSTSTTTSTTTAAPTTTSTTTAAGTSTTTSTTTVAYPPYSYTLYYDYDDSLPNVIGFTNANDACTATNSATVYSYDNPLVAGSELYCEAWYGGVVALMAVDYSFNQNHYRIGNDVIRFTDDGVEGPTNIIYDFVQICGTTTSTTTSSSTTTTTTAAPCSSTDYLLFNETGSPLSWTGLDCNDNSIGNTINSGMQGYTGCVKDGTLNEGSLTIVSSAAC
jgi:hypothetical protein